MTALDALKGACVEVQASRPYPRKHHRTLALWTCGSFDCNRRTAGMLRLGCGHDASLKPAGAQDSLSPVDAEDEPVMEPAWPVRFRLTVQYCSHSKLEFAKNWNCKNWNWSSLLVGALGRASGQTKSAGRNFSRHMLVVAGYPERSVALCADANAHTGSSKTDTPVLVVTPALDITLTRGIPV